MDQLHSSLLLANTSDAEHFIQNYQEKICLEFELQRSVDLESLQLLRIRYRKGLELVKLLYEKVLALDHHFSGMQTYQNVAHLSNPHSFPEFDRINGLLEDKLRKRHAIQLPGLLHTNPYLMATFSVVAAFLGDNEPTAKQKDLDEIACILDFTVRMNADLNTIRHETEYLKRSEPAIEAGM